jgi:hypothetical protein
VKAIEEATADGEPEPEPLSAPEDLAGAPLSNPSS